MGLKKKAIKEVAERTGLKSRTVRDLLDAGWTYHEYPTTQVVWEKPKEE